MNLFSLIGKRILVTGASSGIGRACAIVASQLGATVVMSARRDCALQETLSRCAGDGHLIIAGDIASPSFILGLVENSGKLDGLIHAAGIAPMCPLAMLTQEQLDSVMKINYYAFLELMKGYSKKKYRHDRFSAVAISSVSASVGWAGGTAYCGTKGALSASVRALALELATKGVRINAICPSNIKTPLYDVGTSGINDAESLKELIKRQPLGLGYPEQVAWPACFLLSDAASFITGIDLPVDGGYLAQ